MPGLLIVDDDAPLRSWALRVLGEGGSTDADRLVNAFRRCLARVPNEAETATLLDLLRRQTERFARPEARPWDLAANGVPIENPDRKPGSPRN